MELKLTLEKVYESFCDGCLEGLKGQDEYVDMFVKFVKFRLEVSGGSHSSMGSIGCGSIKGFLNEMFLFLNMMDDWGGCYRGDYSFENLEGLKTVMDELNVEESIRTQIIEGYKKEYEMED
jgi:hypothetical protein